MNDSITSAQLVTRPSSWWQRLPAGSSAPRPRSAARSPISVSKRKLDAATIEDLEERTDPRRSRRRFAARIATAIGEGRYEKGIAADEVKAVLAAEIEKVLDPVAKPLVMRGAKPFVILVVGVNGSGKTTTDRQARGEASRRGRKVDAGRRRHVPRRRHRPIENLGRAAPAPR